MNGKMHSVHVRDDKPLLRLLREDVGLTGTKFGCGIAQRGACSVQLDGQPMRSCVTPVSVYSGRKLTTVEGVDSPAAVAACAAWRELDVVQFGCCQSGQLIRNLTRTGGRTFALRNLAYLFALF